MALEATLAGRRFRIVRSPAWARPKKRGAGTTPQQAAVTISERVDAAWVPLSTRLEETGHLVTALVGMNLTQFTQVAMLPQGRFQAFLRASSEDRHQLLQQLFRTERFEQVERWLRDRRLALTTSQSQDRERAAALLHRVSETAGVPLPENPTARGAGTGRQRRLAATGLTTALPRVIATEEAARTALEAARTTEEHRRRFAAARPSTTSSWAAATRSPRRRPASTGPPGPDRDAAAARQWSLPWRRTTTPWGGATASALRRC